MKNRILALTVLIACILGMGQGMAQNGINVPFSQYGIGLSNAPFSMPFASQMGGVVYTRSGSNMINPYNPASYAAIQPVSFVFDMGIGIEMTTLKDPNTSVYDADGNIAYLTFGMPLTKWWKTAFGILPMTNVNYQSIQTSTAAPWGEVQTVYEGVGGTTRMFWGHGFNVGQHLSLGFNVNFLFDNLNRAITYHFNGNDSSYYMDSRREKTTAIHNITFDMGAQYELPIDDNHTLKAGLTLTPYRKMNVTDNALVYTFVTSSAVEYLRDTIFPVAGQSGSYTSTLEQPTTVGLGISFQRNNQWLIAFDGTYAPWSGIKYTENSEVELFGSSAIRYGDNVRCALGFQFLGNPNDTRYLRRVTYSAGVHYESGKLRLQTVADNTPYKIDEWGLGAGLTFPMRKGRSLLNVSATYSSMGSTDLLRRNYFLIGISVGSCETWFMKRKYN